MIQRTRSDWPVAVAAWVLLACSATLLATAALYADVVAAGSLTRAFVAAPPDARGIAVASSLTPAAVAGFDAVVAGILQETLGRPGGEVRRVLVAGDPFAPQGTSAGDSSQLVAVAAFDGIDGHAALVAGRWPAADGGGAVSGAVEGTLSAGAAAALGLSVGDRLVLVDRLDPALILTATIVGTWRPAPDDPYWRGPLELLGQQTQASFRTRGPLVIPAQTLLTSTARGVKVEWRAIPSAAGIRPDDVGPMRAALASMRDRLRVRGVAGTSVTIESGLPGLLSTIERAILVSRSAIVLVTIQFAVLAGYAILLIGGMLLDRRRGDVAVLRARGATTGRLAGFAVGEALLLAVPAAVVAPFLASAAVRLLGTFGPLAGTGVVADATPTVGILLVAVVTATAGVVILALPTLTTGASPVLARVSLGRQFSRTLAQRLGLDFVLAVVAILALWQLRLYGSPLIEGARGALGLDPLLVAAPALGLLAGAVVATRALPRLTEIGERLLAGRRGLVPPLAARQLARRPLRYTRAALLLMLATALGTFATAYGATWSASQRDQAAYKVAGDVRLVLSDYPTLPGWAAGTAYRAVPGVTAAMPVVRQSMAVGRAVRDGEILAFDAAAAGTIVHLPPADAQAGLGETLAGLATGRPTLPLVDLPGAPSRLGIRIDANLAAVVNPDAPRAIPTDWQGIGVAALLRDADGRLLRLEGGSARFDGAGQRITIPLTIHVDGVDASVAFPVAVAGIELTLTPPAGMETIGSVEVRGLDVSEDATGDAWRAVTGAISGPRAGPGSPAWGWTRTGERETLDYPSIPGAPGRIVLDRAPGPTSALGAYPFDLVVTFRWMGTPAWPGSAGEEIPVIAGETFLRETGSRVGDAVTGSSLGHAIPMRIVASVAAFPPFDPGRPFVVADLPTLDISRLAATATTTSVEEWWLAVPEAASPAVVATLSGAPYSAASVTARADVEQAGTADAVSLGILGALTMGSIAAIVFAAIGFVVGATVATAERLGEFGLLRALGLSHRQLSTWMVMESAFLLGFGLVAGTGLGLLLAWTVLPFAALTASGGAAVPAPQVVVPPAGLVPLWGAAALVLVVTAALVTRQVGRVALADVLRGRDA